MFLRNILRLNLIQNHGVIHEDAWIKRSIIRGAVDVEEGAKILGSMVKGNIQVGRYTSISERSAIFANINEISIGPFCSIARGVSIQEYFHNSRRASTYYISRNICKESDANEELSKGSIEVGADVWIGTGAVIMSGVTIGHGAIVGANAVVTKNIEPYSIYGGVPAKKISDRFSDSSVSNILLDSKWWESDIDTIKVNKSFFNLDLTKHEDIEKLADYRWA